MSHIYIAFVDTPGFFAALIRRFLKQRYIHVVLGFDAELREAYSVGRRNPAVPVFAGFEKEDKGRILHTFPTAFYRICELDCTDVQKKELWERVQEDYRDRFRIHYAVLGLPFTMMNIPFYINNQYTCSSYIARVLQENGVVNFEKHFSVVTPKDFYVYKNMRVVYEGELSQIVAGISDSLSGSIRDGSVLYER
ncbi:MAG: hypothetical protein K2O40_12105 [Lachnospiraceae bacterium]|nr:hypothetical protein [Lachnospiraceae bacterium]MDE7185182.1 hypothetical protein [Lachnospiraceae bacterium]